MPPYWHEIESNAKASSLIKRQWKGRGNGILIRLILELGPHLQKRTFLKVNKDPLLEVSCFCPFCKWRAQTETASEVFLEFCEYYPMSYSIEIQHLSTNLRESLWRKKSRILPCHVMQTLYCGQSWKIDGHNQKN